MIALVLTLAIATHADRDYNRGLGAVRVKCWQVSRLEVRCADSERARWVRGAGPFTMRWRDTVRRTRHAVLVVPGEARG